MSDFQVGEKVFSIGYNTRGRRVVTTCTLVRLQDRDEYGRDCVTESKGVKVLGDSRQLFKSSKDAQASIAAS